MNLFTMEDNEIESFIRKFKSLRVTGYNATLNMECKLGEVFITLNCKVGRSLPPSPSTPTYAAGLKSRSPSYFRRQARRKASREFKDGLADCGSASEEVKDVAAEVDNCCADMKNDSAELEAESSHDDARDACIETEEVDQAELERDIVIFDVIMSAVTKPIEVKEVVEKEIRDRFNAIGVNVVKMDTYCNYQGLFKMSRVKTTPVNLNKIWGRRLGLGNCSAIAYEPPPS